jgi:hypothetical protein
MLILFEDDLTHTSRRPPCTCLDFTRVMHPAY